MLKTAIVVLTSALALAGCSTMPADMRNPDGGLRACDEGPNCVSSESEAPGRRIAPLYYTAMTPAAAQQALANLIDRMEGAEVVENQPGYLHATFDKLLGSDDLELVFTTPGVVRVRSSSRVGYFDFNANRNRVEQLRADFARIQP